MSDRQTSAILQRAIRWISDQRLENPDAALGPLVDEAARRFDLSPQDAEFLLTFQRPRTGDERA
ncbi:hypothetical protein KJ059_16655 [Myxococcota bacterium]|nr:hypothetical protein [Myxococcota bacterium]MCZ7617631.1 hypothetical protein [Myxococcota bacterium]